MEENIVDSDLAIIQYDPHVYASIPITTSLERFLELWLENRPTSTQETYKSDIYRFLLTLPDDLPLQRVTLDHVSNFAVSLGYLKETSKSRILNSLKSMYTFGHKTGYLPANVGAAIRLRKIERHLADRIMSEDDTLAIIRIEQDTRNHALLRFLYSSGCRVSEACKLTWIDVKDRDHGQGQVRLDGKGDKERYVLLPERVYGEIKELRSYSETRLDRSVTEDEPVFRSRKSSYNAHLDRKQVHIIVKTAAIKAGVQIYTSERKRTNKETGNIDITSVVNSHVSPHFFRHAHISHSLDRKVPPHVIQATVGHSSLATTTDYAHARPDTSSALELPA